MTYGPAPLMLKSRAGEAAWAAWRPALGIFALLLLAILGPYLSLRSGPSTGDGNMTRQLGYDALFLFVLWDASVWRRPLRVLMLPLSLLAPIAWCAASAAWSLDPSITWRRLFLTCLVLWTAFISVRRAGFEGATAAIRSTMTLTLIASYVAVFLFPSVGVHQVAEVTDPGLIGDWRGVLQQKNFTGAVCALTILYFIFSGRDLGPIHRAGVLAAAAVFLWMTRSKTSLGLLIAAVLIGGLLRLYNPKYRALVLCALGLATLGLIWQLTLRWADIVAPFSRPESLTGRGQIWLVLVRYARDHPWLGSGYGAFWNIGPASPVYQYGRGWVQGISSGHNGYLDLLVAIGLPGLLLVLAGVLVWPMGKLIWNLRLTPDQRALLASSLLFCGAHNFTESSFFERDQIVEVFIALTLAMIYALADGSLERREAGPVDGA